MENYTEDKIFFLLYTEVVIEHVFVGFIQNMYLSKNQIKIYFLHHVIIERHAMCRTCRRDSKASTVTSYPLENRVYDVTCWLCYPIGTFGIMSCYDKYNHSLNKTMFNKCVCINYTKILISIVVFLQGTTKCCSSHWCHFTLQQFFQMLILRPNSSELGLTSDWTSHQASTTTCVVDPFCNKTLLLEFTRINKWIHNVSSSLV